MSAFEEWLEKDGEPFEPHPPLRATPAPEERDSGSKLSKNRREQLQKEVAQIEQKIADLEGELAAMELSFQNPGGGIDWETTHQKYAQLKTTLEALYEDLANRWELMG